MQIPKGRETFCWYTSLNSSTAVLQRNFYVPPPLCRGLLAFSLPPCRRLRPLFCCCKYNVQNQLNLYAAPRFNSRGLHNQASTAQPRGRKGRKSLSPRTPEIMNDSLSSSNYSANSLIELSQKFIHKQKQSILQDTAISSRACSTQHTPVPSSPSTSHSSYGYQSLLEFTATARGPRKANLITQGSLHRGDPSLTEQSPVEDPGERNTILPGVTTPEDVSLSSEGETGGQSPVKPIKHFSTRDPQKSRSESSSHESELDLYEPPERPPALQGPVAPAQERPPPATLSTYGDFFHLKEQ
jgi:hypothetical protein